MTICPGSYSVQMGSIDWMEIEQGFSWTNTTTRVDWAKTVFHQRQLSGKLKKLVLLRLNNKYKLKFIKVQLKVFCFV